jgi:outer membrane protein assembly factor BamB
MPTMVLLPRFRQISLEMILRARVGLLWVMAASAVAGDWPAFRGPAGNGIAREEKAPLHWASDKNVRWKMSLPGPGNSSPIVSRGRVFITCAESQGTNRNLYCVDQLSGKTLWVQTVTFPGVEPTHRSNSYCASTPVADGSRVVVWHGSAGVFCYDFEGRTLWEKDLGPVRHDWGYASSPILYHGKVILNFGPGSRTFLAALDLKTGDLLWKREESGGLDATDKRMVGSWSTPVVIQVDGKDQILCSMPTRVMACDPETGSLLWFCGGLGSEKVDLVYASPVVSGPIGVAFTGWINGPTIGFKLGGVGDITASNRLWLDKQPQRIGSGVVIDGRLYIVNAGPGTAQCIECRTGKVLWTERLEGGESWGSVLLAAGRLYVTSRRGVTTVFRPNPEKFELMAMNDLGEPSNATPAISDGQIFLRTDEHLYCIAED